MLRYHVLLGGITKFPANRGRSDICGDDCRGERGHAGHVPSGTSGITYAGDEENKNKK